MVTIELNEKMYYACGLCSTDSKVQWHRPGTKTWHEHKKHIDLDETNSDRPKYFWCTHHRRPHDFKRECLKYKAQITHNGENGNHNSPTIQMSHDDVLVQIQKFVESHSDAVKWKKVVRTNSLPWPCDRKTRLLVPDIIYCKPDNSVKFRYSITNVIEFESETSADTIASKVERFNESSRRMIVDGAQSKSVLPRIIFLYDAQTKISIEDVKRAVQRIETAYLDEVIVDHYDDGGVWFEKYFQ
ncbi:MAG: hypothetical protein Q7J10_06820 [Methanosarcinaceae archaeon]|nr:hypothetical protein [Methanosarcinaceae archaeon]